mmetsp:Transcript_4250/g.27131  ORF Transcript_4250/g.27131 Transcript_4250/m.27131 type:complete len:113 (-) Transcript_4250:849-1187(-)
MRRGGRNQSIHKDGRADSRQVPQDGSAWKYIGAYVRVLSSPASRGKERARPCLDDEVPARCECKAIAPRPWRVLIAQEGTHPTDTVDAAASPMGIPSLHSAPTLQTSCLPYS